MKKALILGILGVAAAAATSSYGQGSILFDNYDSTPYMPVVYKSNMVGVADSNYHVDLLYSFGSAVTPTNDLGLSIAISSTLHDSTAGANYGYFTAGSVTCPGYVSGPVSFEVLCWLTVTEGNYHGYATYAAAVAGGNGVIGNSGVWTESSLATGLNPAATFAGLPGPSGAPLLEVAPVPEPSILALSGLGAAALMLIRRKK